MKGVFAGSFDPPTKGHEEIIARCATLFDQVVVMISHNPNKQGLFDVEQRKAWLEAIVAPWSNVEVVICQGLTVQKARALHGDVLIRSLRNESDFGMEANNAWINAHLEGGLETFFLMADPAYTWISSSNVRELLRYHQSVEHLVPKVVYDDLQGIKASKNTLSLDKNG